MYHFRSHSLTVLISFAINLCFSSDYLVFNVHLVFNTIQNGKLLNMWSFYCGYNFFFPILIQFSVISISFDFLSKDLQLQFSF